MLTFIWRLVCFCAFLPHAVCSLNAVITGFNTDIEYRGVVYHVQTEDKGLSRPIILSLVYDRGTILASKRSPYDDLLEGSFDENVLAERLQRQHKLICAAIQAGRIEELRKMTARETPLPETVGTMPSPVAAATPVVSVHAGNGNNLPDFDAPIPKPVFEKLPSVPKHSAVHELVLDGVSVIEEVVLAADAVAVVSEPETGQPPYIDPADDKLGIELLGNPRLKGGDRRTISLMASRGKSRRVVGNAQVMVKILGSSFRPLIFHASTDANGVANIELHLPNFNTGRAALLIRAISDGEEVELRRSVEHG